MPDLIILQGDRLKGQKTAYRWVEYWPNDNLGFLVPDVDNTLELEEICDLLAERVEMDYPGQGIKAYEAAREQLATKDFQAEWVKLQAQIAAYKRWGGPPPAAVLIPDPIDRKSWQLVVPLDMGLGPIEVFKVRPEVVRELPYPEQGRTAYRDEFGWKAIPPRQAVERSRLQKKVLQAKLRHLGERRVTVPALKSFS